MFLFNRCTSAFTQAYLFFLGVLLVASWRLSLFGCTFLSGFTGVVTRGTFRRADTANSKRENEHEFVFVNVKIWSLKLFVVFFSRTSLGNVLESDVKLSKVWTKVWLVQHVIWSAEVVCARVCVAVHVSCRGSRLWWGVSTIIMKSNEAVWFDQCGLKIVWRTWNVSGNLTQTHLVIWSPCWKTALVQDTPACFPSLMFSHRHLCKILFVNCVKRFWDNYNSPDKGRILLEQNWNTKEQHVCVAKNNLWEATPSSFTGTRTLVRAEAALHHVINACRVMNISVSYDWQPVCKGGGLSTTDRNVTHWGRPATWSSGAPKHGQSEGYIILTRFLRSSWCCLQDARSSHSRCRFQWTASRNSYLAARHRFPAAERAC